MKEQQKPELIILDLDSTLVNTGPLFSEAYQKLELAILNLFKEDRWQIIDSKEFVKKFFTAERKCFSKGQVNIRTFVREIIKELLRDIFFELKEVDDELGSQFDQLEEDLLALLNIFDSIYEQIPETFPDAVSLLKELHDLAIPFIICSHSGQDWLALKIAALAQECGFDLPAFAVELDDFKDELALRNVLIAVNQDRVEKNLPQIGPESVAVVGDSLRSDIYSAYFAEFAVAIWINSSNKPMSEQDKRILMNGDESWRLMTTNDLLSIPHLLALTTCYNQTADTN